MHIAAITGHAAAVRLLLDSAADKEAKDEGGKTPLHHAATGGPVEVVQLLVDAGAAKNPYRSTLYDLASCDAVLRLLREDLTCGS